MLRRSSGWAMFQNATDASWLATCLSWYSLAMSPIAHTPSTAVRMCSSTTIVPWWWHVEPADLDVEQVAVGLAAGRHEQFVDLDHLTRAMDRDVVADAFDLGGQVLEVEVDALREQLGEALRDVFVLGSQQHFGAVEDRHLGTQPREHVAHLDGDVTAADDAEPVGQRVEAHDRVRGVESGLDQARYRRDHRPGTGCDEDMRRGDPATFDVEQLARRRSGRCPRSRSCWATRSRGNGDHPRRSGRCGRTRGRGSPPSRRRGIGHRSPARSLWAASTAMSAGSTNIFDGMQPTLRQVPPNVPRSTIAIFRSARNAGIAFPEPLPMMIRSNCSAAGCSDGTESLNTGPSGILPAPAQPNRTVVGLAVASVPVTRSYVVRTYGCQMNEHDSERIAGLLEADGLVARRVARTTPTSSCSTRAASARTPTTSSTATSATSRPWKDAQEGRQIVVSGCLAQKDRDLVAGKAGVRRRRDGHPQRPPRRRAARRGRARPTARSPRSSTRRSSTTTRCSRRRCRLAARPATTRGSRSRSAATTTARSASCRRSAASRSAGRSTTSSPRSASSPPTASPRSRCSARTSTATAATCSSPRARPATPTPSCARCSPTCCATSVRSTGIRRVRFTSPHPKDMRPETFAAMADTAGRVRAPPLPAAVGQRPGARR